MNKIYLLMYRLINHVIFLLLFNIFIYTTFFAGRMISICVDMEIIEEVSALEHLLGPHIVSIWPRWAGRYMIRGYTVDFLIFLLVFLIVFDLLYTILLRRWINEKLFGIGIESKNGKKANILQLIARELIKYLCLAFAPYLLVIPLLNARSRALHDYVAGTYVDTKKDRLKDSISLKP